MQFTQEEGIRPVADGVRNADVESVENSCGVYAHFPHHGCYCCKTLRVIPSNLKSERFSLFYFPGSAGAVFPVRATAETRRLRFSYVFAGFFDRHMII